MSTVVRPSGHLPPRVYWVRRLLLVAVVAAIVWGVVRVVGGGDPASGEPAGDTATTTDAPEDTDAEKETANRTLRESRRDRRTDRLTQRVKLHRSQRVRDVAEELDGPSGACDLTLVRVVPQVPSPSYAGASVLLRLGLRTEQATPCTIELDADRLLVSVSSVEQVVTDEGTSEATDVVWSSAQCRDAVPLRTVVLRPSWTSTVDLSWSGLHGGRRCRDDGKPADAGSYRLQAAALTGEPAEVDFDLVDPSSMDRPVDERDLPNSASTGDDQAGEDQGGGQTGRGQQGDDADPPADQQGDDQEAADDAADPPADQQGNDQEAADDAADPSADQQGDDQEAADDAASGDGT